MFNDMRILELCGFSAGICGVFTRAREEAVRLKMKGHHVEIFSSNLVKGSNEIAKEDDKIEGIKIKRFPVAMPGKGKLWFVPGGESYMFWNYNKLWKEVKRFKPDIIIAHGYRQWHTTKALKIAKKIKSKKVAILCLSGRGDKDIGIIRQHIKFG